ncbi:MAG: molybdopterin cofactor-binding domain-containing protein [Polyangiaceae bacterium]
MSAREPTRRNFLTAMLTAGGALAMGVVLPACAGSLDPRTAAHFGRTGELMPNAWIKILPDNKVIFLLDRVEFGQGTTTSHAMLVGEELEVDPSRIEVRHAPASRDYDMPLLELGIQNTGGSASVRTSWVPLRKAAASTREMLKAAAAAKWEVDIAELTVEDGVVHHAGKKLKATYGELAGPASRQPIPDPPLKPASQRKWIGKSLRRLDARSKVDGSAVYGIDVKLPGLLTAVVLRSPTLGGKLKSFRADAAKREPGVVSVVQIPTGVAVVAKSYWEARSASKKVEVDWDPGPLAGKSTDSIREDFAARSRSPGQVIQDDGDTEAAFRDPTIVEAVYEVPYLAHATMAAQNATAHVADGRCEIWAPTQSPGLAVEEAFRITGLDRSAITLHTTQIGGAFGRRIMPDYVGEAVHVSKALAKPVKVVWSREDDFQHEWPHGLQRPHGLGEREGEVTGWFHRIVSQSPAASQVTEMMPAPAGGHMSETTKEMLGRTATGFYKRGSLPDLTVVEGAHDFAYSIPNVRVEHVTVDLPRPLRILALRRPLENVYIVETFLDEPRPRRQERPDGGPPRLLAASPPPRRPRSRGEGVRAWRTPRRKASFRGLAVARRVRLVLRRGHRGRCRGRPQGPPRRRRHRLRHGGETRSPSRAQIESGIFFGLSAALRQRITLKDGRVEQT